MWLRVTLAFAALHLAEPLREIHPFNIHPSLVSNIHLLVPLKVTDNQRLQPEPRLRISDSWEESKESGQLTGHDESFSDIPGYAFTLDTDSILTNKGTVPKPEVQVNSGYQTHSLYSDHEWPHSHNAGHGSHRSDLKDEHSEKSAETTEARLRECRTLGRHHSPESREMLVQLCSELVELLASRCKCCDEQPRARTQKVNNVGVAMPWFGSFDSRRDIPPANEDLGQVAKPRVMV